MGPEEDRCRSVATSLPFESDLGAVRDSSTSRLRRHLALVALGVEKRARTTRAIIGRVTECLPRSHFVVL